MFRLSSIDGLIVDGVFALRKSSKVLGEKYFTQVKGVEKLSSETSLC
jgi:hypothetical protein